MYCTGEPRALPTPHARSVKNYEQHAGEQLNPDAPTRIRLDVRWYYPSLSSNLNRPVLVQTTQWDLTWAVGWYHV